MDMMTRRPEPEAPDSWGRTSPRDDDWRFFEAAGFRAGGVSSDGWATSWIKGHVSVWAVSPYDRTGPNWMTCWTLDIPEEGPRVVGHLGPFSRETAVTRPQPDERAFTRSWDYWRGWINAHRGHGITYPAHEGFVQDRYQGWLDGKTARRMVTIGGTAMKREEYETVTGTKMHCTSKAVLLKVDERDVWIPLSCLGLGTDREAESAAPHTEIEVKVAQFFARREGLV